MRGILEVAHLPSFPLYFLPSSSIFSSIYELIKFWYLVETF